MRLYPRPGGESASGAAVRAAVVAGAVAALSALAWTRTLQVAFLGLAGALAAAGLLWGLLGRREPTSRPALAALLALVLLLGAAASGAVTEWRLRRLATDWEQVVRERRDELSRRLDRRIGELIARASDAAEAAGRAGPQADPSALVPELRRLRAGSDVAALALVDAAGELVAWAGDHRGSLPAEVRHGGDSVVFAERPLFTYLYVTRPGAERGMRAVAAVLLETDLALSGERVPSFADRFQRSTGARPRFLPGGTPGGESGTGAVWTLESGGRPVVSARLEVPTQAEWRRRIISDGRQAAALLVAGALTLLFGAWRRLGPRKDRALATWPGTGRLAPAALPLGVLAAALLLLPLGDVVGAGNLFSPADFLLPLPIDVTLGMLLAVVVPVSAFVAAAGEPAWVRHHPWVAAFAGATAVAIAYPLLIGILLRSASLSLLEGGPGLWWGLQVTGAVLLSIVTGWLLPSGGQAASEAPPAGPADLEVQRDGRAVSSLPGRGGPLAAALVLSAGLGVLAMSQLDPRSGPMPAAAALWAVPFLIAARALPPARARGSRILRWLVAGWLAASALLPQLWLANVAARLEAAEVELTSLGTQSDPLLHYLLQRFAAEAERRGNEGESGVELLYRSWVASGLAEGGYPAWISLWDDEDQQQVTLEVGATPQERRTGGESAALVPLLLRARAAGAPLIEVAPTRHVNLAMALPLSDERIVTVAVPPRRSLEAGTSLLRSSAEGELRLLRLTLVPATTPGGLREDSVRWVRSEEGWRSEAVVPYPDGNYHAHLELHVAPLGVRVARGILLVALDLGVLAFLWLLGRVAGGEPPAPLRGWRAWGGSFRARITAALLAFFLAPTFLFGAVAYRSLSGEVVRSARLVAERSAQQAVTAFEAAEGDLTALAAFTGTDVLFYHRGELAGSSAPEAFDLGLYGAWMPAPVFLTLESGEELAVVEEREVVGRPYVVAYHSLPATGTLAVPVSLSAGEAAIRQRELAHLVLFAALFGGLLSLTLSVAVARALAHPIGRLRRAAATVGAGRLDARLPEDRRDEFGELFASFNRMTLQLRRARARELRTARVLAWGEMARQVAHEIKNPLTPIKLSIQHVRRAYADKRADFETILDSNVQQILAEIDRLSEIARAFSRYGAPAEAAGPLEEVDVTRTVREVLALYRSGETALEYAADLDEGLPAARARVGELKEVLVNLLENARAAVDGPGRITVSAAWEGARILLQVRDEGKGIPPELLPRVFDPQFSTRSSGTGLGLAIVRRLVEGWGGQVGVTSEQGKGTVVRVWLPVADERASE